MFVIVARRAAAGRGAGKSVTATAAGKKSRVEIAENTVTLPSMEPVHPPSAASSDSALASSASISSLPSVDRVALQQSEAVSVSCSLELGASVEVVAGPSSGPAAAPQTVMLGKCYCVLICLLCLSY